MSRPTGLRSGVIAQEPGLIAVKCRMVFYMRTSVESIRFWEKEMAIEGEGLCVFACRTGEWCL